MTAIIDQINPAPPQIMWIDLNSAFATIEQQAHPSLRHKPVGITNRISPECCIITASYEAKVRGVKAGSRRSEALRLCPDLILLESNPAKYSFVYDKLYSIMRDYSSDCGMKSIDEGFVNLQNTPYQSLDDLVKLAQQIKWRVNTEIGNYVTVNIGLASNRFLAKLAANLHKPNGLDVITADNLTSVYSQLELEDLTGIAKHLGKRLRRAGINNPSQFLLATEPFLRRTVFHGINGTYWYQRLRGYEVDDHPTNLTTIGRQWVVDNNRDNDDYLLSCLHFLTESVGLKLRFRHVLARGVGLWLRMQSGNRYSKKYLSPTYFDSNQSIWSIVELLFNQRPAGQVCCMGIYLYNFAITNKQQSSILADVSRANRLTRALDSINHTYGTATIHSAHSSAGASRIRQKVPFGSTNYLDLLID